MALAHPCLQCSAGTIVPVRFWPWWLCRQHGGLIQGCGPRPFPLEDTWERPHFPWMGCECKEKRHFDWKPGPDNSCGPALLASKDVAFCPHGAGDPIKKPSSLAAEGQSRNSQLSFLLHLLGVELYFCPSSSSVWSPTWRTIPANLSPDWETQFHCVHTAKCFLTLQA